MNLLNGYDVFFLDLDGTLIDGRDKNGKKVISKLNLDALQAILDHKKHFVISTGRLGANVLEFLEATNTEYAVLGNGSQIYAKGKILREYKLSPQQVELILEFARKHRMVFKFDDDHKAYGAVNFVLRYLSKRYSFTPQEHYDFDMSSSRHKIVMWGKTRFGMARIIRKLHKAVPGLSIVSAAHSWTFEVTIETATKGHGNEFVATELLNIPKARTVHIGDTMNDSTTKGHVGILIALANADKHLKNVADFIGPHYANGGVAKLINGQVRLELPKKRQQIILYGPRRSK